MTRRSCPRGVPVSSPDLLPEQRLDLLESADNALAISVARHFAREMGFDDSQEFLIATAVSELATNILRYAGKGQMTFRVVEAGGRLGMEVVAIDGGPGIADIEKAMADHYSTGDSLGLGLPSVRRIMDSFQVESRPGLTICVGRKWRE
ncbi:MAG: anti-sigma regulatory factor (Ser/Thr protein kinase) [Solidesulfovibrio magneticus str. Maddingley MBC34]|uniref:Anti-sigma regulatory factor (Ser/Thr protein kinase) n=1 Tax=Solidesulfovibrio magneticus str. Maddingley MBC34 TaxID=1206767 RepID=K6FPQ9_9BACT|nr:MAG: anti-sigma regulatory factor (Ser/Thr protein kinase) [Solidesulfovibrio magneticus str. Maddingley MBC34]